MYLWFGSPCFDPEVEHVTVLSASSGDAEAGEALARAFEDYCQAGEEPPASLPTSEPVTVTTDGKPTGPTPPDSSPSRPAPSPSSRAASRQH